MTVSRNGFSLIQRWIVAFGFCLYTIAPGIVRAADDDRASSLIGDWTCTTYIGTTATKHITRNADGELLLENVFLLTDGSTQTVNETYSYDTAAGTWAVIGSATPAFGPYSGKAKPWTGQQWVFDGSEPLAFSDGTRKVTNVRMVYTDVFPAGFRREHQIQNGGAWRDISEEVCTK
jgi:hypothetical protein